MASRIIFSLDSVFLCACLVPLSLHQCLTLAHSFFSPGLILGFEFIDRHHLDFTALIKTRRLVILISFLFLFHWYRSTHTRMISTLL